MTIKLIKKLKKLDDALFDIYVVDNCSPNESADVLKKESVNLEYHFYKNEVMQPERILAFGMQ